MHILIIPSERYVPDDAPLQGIFQRDQAEALQRAGHTIGVLSLHLASIRENRRDRNRLGFNVETKHGIPVLNFYSYALPRSPLTYRVQWQWVGPRLLRRYRIQHGTPDVIHAHNALWAGWVAAQLKDSTGLPYALTEHSSGYGRGLIRASERAYIRRAFKCADARLVVSPALGHNVESVIGEDARPWKWLPNILDPRFAHAELGDSRAGATFRYLCIGSLNVYKGQADLLRAFALAFAGESQVELRLGGDGPQRRDLEKLAAALQIDRQVVFLGTLTREAVLAEMQACDAYVQPSHLETFGVALIEALACGKPVIATQCGGPESIVNASNGLLVPTQNPASLSAALIDLRLHSGRYAAASIRRDCIDRFGEKAIVSQLIEVYRGICAPWGEV